MNKLWEKAKQIIPGGNQLISKRPDQFLPTGWPTYYEHALGISIWDLKGKEYQDFSTMGIGSCILGYRDQQVDVAVLKAILAGNMTTLNCPEEVELAEKLLDLHPWADMVRYARTGGEANAIAIRLARAYTGKDKVAFSGYHGWHDWYLSANLENKNNLDKHLLPNINPIGIPKGLKGITMPFTTFDELKKTNADIVIMEIIRHKKPDIDYLKKIREYCSEKNKVLIFDEVTSGFRETLGGYHTKINVNPDLCVFGKGMSNGYPMSAVIGKKEIMKKTQDSFISSTYWTDKIGPVATLATIDKLEQYNVPYNLCRSGEQILNGWRRIASKHGIGISIKDGFLPIVSFEFWDKHKIKRTFFIQEMLKEGYLANNTVYLSYAHTDKDIRRYLEKVDIVFEQIAKGNIKLDSPVAKTGLRRVT